MHRIETSQTLQRPTTVEPPSPPPVPGRPGPRPKAHRRRSRAALNLRGLCPVCGEEAQRRVTATRMESRETYCCPVDGETVYLLDHSGRRIQVAGGFAGPDAWTPGIDVKRRKVEDLLTDTGFVPLEAAI